jgi:hypothetical protein
VTQGLDMFINTPDVNIVGLNKSSVNTACTLEGDRKKSNMSKMIKMKIADITLRLRSGLGIGSRLR